MHKPQEDIAGLGVFLLYIAACELQGRKIAGAIALREHSGGLHNAEDVVVFVENCEFAHERGASTERPSAA